MSLFLQSDFIKAFNNNDLKKLTDISSQINLKEEREIVTRCFFSFLEKPDLEPCFSYLCQQNITLETHGILRQSFLSHCVDVDNLSASKLLIENGAEINEVDKILCLIPVFFVKSTGMIMLLKSYKANFNYIDSAGDSILHHLAHKESHSELFKKIIKDTDFSLMHHKNSRSESILDIFIRSSTDHSDDKLSTMLYLYQQGVDYNELLLNQNTNQTNTLFCKNLIINQSTRMLIKSNKKRF